VFDATRVLEVVTAFAPDLVMHQLTDLPDALVDARGYADANARIRRDGTRNLLTAAGAAAASRFVAQSVAWELRGSGGAAVEDLESTVLAAGGVVLRYGQFYGPGTYHPDEPPDPPRVHVDTAAARTVALLDAASGVITVVDEE
jgi:hypothetical protein